jgi:hypothetical protein
MDLRWVPQIFHIYPFDQPIVTDCKIETTAQVVVSTNYKPVMDEGDTDKPGHINGVSVLFGLTLLKKDLYRKLPQSALLSN